MNLNRYTLQKNQVKNGLRNFASYSYLICTLDCKQFEIQIILMFENPLCFRLNEGFAVYIEYKGVKSAEPTWDMDSKFLVDDLHRVSNEH